MSVRRWKTAIFLCILVLVDEFCVKAEYIPSSYQVTGDQLGSHVADNALTDNTAAVNDLDVYKSNVSSDLSTRREKRAVIVAILVGASIVASLANLGFDIYLHIKGCCGVYKKVCDYQEEFDRLKGTLTTKSREVDNTFTFAENVKQWVKQCNYQNREIWLELNRIADVQDELVEALSVDVIIGFDNTSTALKTRIRDKNMTVIGLTQGGLSTEYQSAFRNAESTLLAITGIVGNIGSLVIGKAMQSYKYNKMANFLKTTEGSRLVNAQPKAHKLLGVSKTNINQHYRATAKAQYKANYKPIKAKVASGAAAVLAVITIGLEIYSAVMKIKACQNIRDNAHDAVKEMRKADSSMDKTLKDVREYKTDVTVDGWNKIKSELLKTDLSDVLTEIRTLAQSAATQSKAMTETVAAIDEFKRDISSATGVYHKTFDLQKRLVKGLAGLKFSLECYTSLVKATTYMFDHCKKGDGRFDKLWDDVVFHFGLNSRRCKDDGVAYTTKANMQDTINKQAAKQNFNPDCILNNKDIIYLTCAKKDSGYSASQIASQLKLTVSQVNVLLPNCPPKPITPHIIGTICRLYGNRVDLIEIATIVNLEFNRVAATIVNHCLKTNSA